MGTLAKNLSKQLEIVGHASNLFEVVFYNIDGTLDSGPDAILYCTGYDLPAPVMKITQNPLTKVHYVEKYEPLTAVSITWQENVSLDVWRYHQNWMSSFYDRSRDMYVSGAAGKKRNAVISLQKYSGGAGQSVAEDPLVENYRVELFGMIPKSPPPLRGSWSDDVEKGSVGIIVQYTVDYVTIQKMYNSIAILVGAI